MRALWTAGTGMMAQQTNVEVISNNIANMSTTGFKRRRAEFQDLLRRTIYIHQRLHREWPALARRYLQALPDIVSTDQWAKTFEHSASQEET